MRHVRGHHCGQISVHLQWLRGLRSRRRKIALLDVPEGRRGEKHKSYGFLTGLRLEQIAYLTDCSEPAAPVRASNVDQDDPYAISGVTNH
jgi:hypothetical protein